MSAVRVSTCVESQFYGRLGRKASYHAKMVGDVIEVRVYDSPDDLGFTDMFYIRVLNCQDIKTIYITDVMAMMGDIDSPYSDMVYGFKDTDKYMDYLHNYVMIVRDMFPGYDVRRVDDGTFTQVAADFIKKYEEHKAIIVQIANMSFDLADLIVTLTIPSWATYIPLQSFGPDNDDVWENIKWSDIEFSKITANTTVVTVAIDAK